MALNKVFDGLLVLQYKAGNKKALGLLVKRYHTKFCKHAYWFTKDKDASKDVAQESWNSVIKNIDKLKDENSFGSWSLRIVTRMALDYVKKNQKELERNKELYNLKKTQEIPVDTKEQDLVLLKKGIEKLSDNQKIVLQLFYTQGYSLKEMSSILEVSVGTVKSRLFNAREKLKLILKK
ncbi:RNA polymerase sigma factor [uncultured Maribacter sp.]|uniref:RNA polymerase sigma factor n=1 Tax=uncultured Maribacter sp. TaxID=431308 RepID=UPI00260A798F|nr:RNA polymerase sigma factor [uncultured Maribacter sp.]